MSLFSTEMESERLVYERVHSEDTDPFELYEHVRTGAPDIDEITEYVTWDSHEHPKETAEFVKLCGKEFENDEGASYIVRPKTGEHAGELAGMAALEVDWDLQTGTLGTWFRKPFWGRGYSGERAARLLKVAFDRLDLDAVIVSHDPDNDNSQRAIEKYVERFGGRREGHLIQRGSPAVHGGRESRTLRETDTIQQPGQRPYRLRGCNSICTSSRVFARSCRY